MEGDSWIGMHMTAVNESKGAECWFVTAIQNGAAVDPSQQSWLAPWDAGGSFCCILVHTGFAVDKLIFCLQS